MTESNAAQIRAWQVCDEDIVGAATWEEAVAWYVKETGVDRDDLNEETEVPLTNTLWADESMTKRITLAESIDEHRRCGGFPAVICSTEW